MNKKPVTVGVDIGTSKVSALICEPNASGGPEVIGVGQSPSAGMKKGIIIDIEATAGAVSDAVARAENMAGCGAVAVAVNVAGAHISSMNSKGVVAVLRPDREISADDVQRVLEAAKVVALPPDREILHVLPKEFVIDGCRGIRQPVGMTGIRLEVETSIITGSATSIRSVGKAMSKSGLDVSQAVLQALASGEAVLTPEEKDWGVVVLDMGAGTTDIGVFKEGTLWHTTSIPLGGNHITNDIAQVLRIPVPDSEQLKLDHGHARSGLVPEDERVASARGEDVCIANAVSRRELCAIIEARVAQILGYVKNELSRVGLIGQLPAGVVLTGGSAMLAGLSEAAEDVLELPARIGYPRGISGSNDVISHPSYATAVGLVKYGWIQGQVGKARRDRVTKGRSFSEGIREWFRSMFTA